jgi:hypothetical protein
MSRSTDVFNDLVSMGLTPVGRVVENPDKENSFLVFLRRSYDDEGNPQPSKRLISSIVKEFAKGKIGLVVAFLDEKAIRLNSAVAKMLSSKFPETVVNSVVSLEKEGGLVSVDLSDRASEEDIVGIEREIRELLGYLGAVNLDFNFSTPLPFPTVTACIGVVRKNAPITFDELIQRLIDAGFAKPSEVWLNGILDRWRRSGFLHRREDKHFVLTLEGLNHLGTSRDRNSPDNGRALAIGRLN